MLTSKHYLTRVFCRGVVFVLCMSLATGCTTLKPLAPAEPESILAQIKPGDTVRLTTRDGRVRDFTVKEATIQHLVGENERVNLSDISDMERREFSTGKTVAIVVGTVVLAIVAFFVFFYKPTQGVSIGRIT